MLNMTLDDEGRGYIGTFNVVVNANQTGQQAAYKNVEVMPTAIVHYFLLFRICQNKAIHK